jgi:hypothetical protein
MYYIYFLYLSHGINLDFQNDAEKDGKRVSGKASSFLLSGMLVVGVL